MWPQNYSPLSGSVPLSALAAALPIFTLLYLLGIRRKPSWVAGLSGLGAALVVALFLYRMPPALAASAILYGAAYALFPITWVIFWAIFLYRLTVETGQFEVVKKLHCPPDARQASSGSVDRLRLRRLCRRGRRVRHARRGGGGHDGRVGVLTVLCFGHLSSGQHRAGGLRKPWHSRARCWPGSPACRSIN